MPRVSIDRIRNRGIVSGELIRWQWPNGWEISATRSGVLFHGYSRHMDADGLAQVAEVMQEAHEESERMRDLHERRERDEWNPLQVTSAAEEGTA
jgi:hypothetical protein